VNRCSSEGKEGSKEPSARRGRGMYHHGRSKDRELYLRGRKESRWSKKKGNWTGKKKVARPEEGKGLARRKKGTLAVEERSAVAR